MKGNGSNTNENKEETIIIDKAKIINEQIIQEIEEMQEIELNTIEQEIQEKKNDEN